MDNLLEYLSLSLNFIGICIAPIFAIIGVILGAALSYYWQVRLNRKQRDWNLDDQKREWKRKRLSTIADRFNEHFVYEVQSLATCGLIAMMDEEAGISCEDLDEIRKKREEVYSRVNTEVDLSFDPRLNKIWQEHVTTVQPKIIKAYSPDGNIIQITDASISVIATNRSLQNRINELIEETFD